MFNQCVLKGDRVLGGEEDRVATKACVYTEVAHHSITSETRRYMKNMVFNYCKLC